MMEEQLVVLMDPWDDKYGRLMEAHEKLQKLNQNLEEKLLKLAENHHTESQRLLYQVHELTQRLVEARLYIHQLEDENDRYRSDINVVVQLLHCKPSNFVSPKLDALPDDLQRKVVSLRSGSNLKKEKKIIKVQVPTFPPTDIMYSVDKGRGKKSSEKDAVSAAIMAKILQEREAERKENRKNRCKCASKIVLPLIDSEAQTMPSCTISYSDFNFSDFDDDEDEEEDVEEDEEDVIYDKKTGSKHSEKSPSSVKYTTITPATVDEIMKTDQKEEELLPTPLFLRRNKEILMKHESQDSTYSSGSSNCNTTTNSSNSNISHSSRMSVGAFEEEIPHPSPTCNSNSHSVSSASPDIQIGGNQSHFFEDFDSEAIIQQFNQSLLQRSAGSNSNILNNAQVTDSQSNVPPPPQPNYFSFEAPTVGRKVAKRPQSMNFNRGGGGGVGAVGGESHWRSTVLVHHPPRKSHSYEPLALTSTHQNTTTFSSTNTHIETLLDSPGQEENPLLQRDTIKDINSQTHTTAQYYRAQKNNKAFWTRTNSTMSTETEI